MYRRQRFVLSLIIHTLPDTSTNLTPNIPVPMRLPQTITLLTSVLEVAGLNLCWDTGYLEFNVSWFSSDPPDKFRDGTSEEAATDSYHTPAFHYSLTALQYDAM
jgi:hypothetical protein